MTDILLLKHIPETLVASVIETLALHTVAFLRIEKHAGGRDANLLGSGVFVSAGKQRAILTAHHVLEQLEGATRIPLFLQKAREPHTIDAAGVQLLKIARGRDEAVGPDLGALVLAPQIAGALETKKVAYNLDRRRDQLLNDPPPLDLGPWFAQGFLEERTAVMPAPDDGEPTKYFYNFTGMGGPDEIHTIGEYDYLDFPVSYEAREGSPVRWGGMSGGGLWQVPIRRMEDRLVPLSPILSLGGQGKTGH
jgi:hypothetical protein